LLIRVLIRKILILINLFSLTSLLFCQEIPNEFYDFIEQKVLSENGYNWSVNTTFGPSRYKTNPQLSDSLRIISKFGIIVSNKNKSLFGYGRFSYKRYFHGYLYPRVVDNPNLVDRFSGLQRDISRGGFNAGETDLSGITFEKDWMIFQFGRGRQSWGAGNNIQLALSENSPPYDYGLVDLNFPNLRVRYFHGFLESDSLQINRYINGRGIEWKNNKNLLISISETIIYSGVNRNIDFTYLNPISTHLEIELNEKQNLQGTDNGNGVWQIAVDFLGSKNLRISLNYLFDEFTLDKFQKEEGKENFNAYSFKLIKSLLKNNNHLLNIYFSRIMVGKNTFRHENGKNNFVHRNEPLGHYLGSDFSLINIGLNSFYYHKLLSNIEFGYKEQGFNSIINSPYGSYNFSNVNHNKLSKIKYLNIDMHYWYAKNISLFSKGEFIVINSNKKSFNFTLGLNIHLDILKVI